MLAIEKLAQHRTVILIAHRLSTVRNCERIFTFQDGTIVSQGTHSELATSCPIYQELLNQKEKSDGV
jgi:ABC-type multidrug transport system fused ATPase/permease subunit